jgi:endonuclease G
MTVGGPGFDPEFLGVSVAEPGAGAWAEDLVEVAGEQSIGYTRFSLALSRTRRLARWVAWNIDGAQLPAEEDAPSREGIDFRPDPRVPANLQVLDDVYVGNELDRGHIARRADLIWGPRPEAERANRDSFYFTNICPQMSNFNQSFRHGLWGLLENALLAEVHLDAKRVSVVAGPIPATDDPTYRGVQVPMAYWKTLTYRMNATLHVRAFLLTQSLDGLEARSPLDEFTTTYELSLTDLETRTGLQFDEPVQQALNTHTGSRDVPPRRLSGLSDITW